VIEANAQTTALRIYRRLALAFPHEFKLVYGADMIQLGEDSVEGISKRHGAIGLVQLIADIAVRVVIEYLSEMRRDMLYAVRGLMKSPGFALVGVISLALGMGVTTSMFSKLYAQLFRSLPGAAAPQELVIAEAPVSYYYIDRYREQHGLLAGAAAFQNGVPFNVAFEGAASTKIQRVFGHLVSPDYFSVLGVQPQAGRMFSTDLDKPGNAPVVVISDRFWRNRLNSAADAVGLTLRLNGQTATIVGIGPRDFNGALPIVPAELFVPVTVTAALAPELAGDALHKRDAKQFIPLMRLAPGITQESAEVGLDAITRRLDEETVGAVNQPASRLKNDKSRRVGLLPGGTMFPVPRALKPVVIAFYALLSGLILTIACMNLANMLLARGGARRKELAIRLAVGASRFRLVRQMMAEGVLLAIMGGAAGLVLAYWLARLASQLKLPLAFPTEFDYSPDWRALVFTFAVSIVCGLGFSIVPALQAAKQDVAPALKEGAGVELRRHRLLGMRNLLVVGQVAGSLMVLLITGFLVIGFSKTSGVHAAFDPNTMYLLSIDPVRDGYSAQKAQALFEALPDRLMRIGGVRNVALAAQPPFSLDGGTSSLTAPDSMEPSQTLKTAAKEAIGAGYFAALREPMLQGREFQSRDQGMKQALALPIVLNATAARGLFGNANPVGRRITEEAQAYEVIGVVRDLKAAIDTSQAVVYRPLAERDFASPPQGGMTIMVRADAGSDTMAGIRLQIADIDPNLVVFNVRTLSDYLDISKAYTRLSTTLFGGIGLFGLLLAAIGLAGVTAYSVARRRKEIGIRMALGARKGQVLRLVLLEGATLVVVGTALGFLGAMWIAKGLSAITHMFVEAFEFGADDPRLLMGAPLLLAALAMLACYIPARRSTRIDPLKTLREE
jgi:predicted permease